MPTRIDDAGTVAARHPDTQSALVAERLSPVRHAADLAALLADIDGLAAAGARTFAFLARTVPDDIRAVVFVDSATEAGAFMRRFCEIGTPSIWHCSTVLHIQVAGLDPYDLTTQVNLRALARGRWYRRDDRSPTGLADAATPPRAVDAASPGAGRAARRRQGRAG
jgi:hypothetical protein